MKRNKNMFKSLLPLFSDFLASFVTQFRSRCLEACVKPIDAISAFTTTTGEAGSDTKARKGDNQDKS
jgi:hypothetical protein